MNGGQIKPRSAPPQGSRQIGRAVLSNVPTVVNAMLTSISFPEVSLCP